MDWIYHNGWEEELVELRREFHRYPEPFWREFRTTARIVEELEALGLTVRYGEDIHVREQMMGLPADEAMDAAYARACGEHPRAELLAALRGGYTGCAAWIEGALPGPSIAVRVDIDANEVTESTDAAHRPAAEGFASCHNGAMHACGHDAHTAIGIGLARLLCANRAQLHGRVLLVFQPGEEGLHGAASLVASGLFRDCDYLFGLHVGLVNAPLGTVAASACGFLPSTKIDVSFRGVAAHAGAAPEQGANAMAAAAAAVTNLLAISRHHAGASFINVGTFRSGTGRNVIPAEAELTLETRGATDEINDYMVRSVERVCRAAAEMYGCGMELRQVGHAGGGQCDADLAAHAAEILATVDGVTEVLPCVDFHASEDITVIMKEVQSHGGKVTELVFPMHLIAPHHNDRFDLDERVMPLALRCLAALIERLGAE